MDGLVEAARESIEGRDWDRLRTILHPYIRWTFADGSLLRGRLKGPRRRLGG